MTEKGLYLRGYGLAHPPSCPGCGGTGVEDISRWGNDELGLCGWRENDGLWVPSLSGIHERCACKRHVMNVIRTPGVPVVELDDRGEKHGFERCPPDESRPCAFCHIRPVARTPEAEQSPGQLAHQFVDIALLALGSFAFGCYVTWRFLS